MQIQSCKKAGQCGWVVFSSRGLRKANSAPRGERKATVHSLGRAITILDLPKAGRPSRPNYDHTHQETLLAEAQTPTDRVDLLAGYEGLASLYADRDDFANALRILALAKELAPSNPSLGNLEGLILAQSGQWALAEPILEQSYRSQPGNENVLLGLGLVAWQYRRDLSQAQAFFLRALAVHTENDAFQAALHNNLGGVFAEEGDYASAIEQFRAAIGISPENPEYHTNLANALGAANRYAEARMEAETALRIDPNYAPARAVLEALGSR